MEPLAAQETDGLTLLLESLDRSLLNRLFDLEAKVVKDILPFATPTNYTDHGVKHARAVRENLVRLLPKQMPEPLTGFEVFSLLVASMLHDIGNVLPASPDEALPQIRLDHYERSKAFIAKNHLSLGLSEHESLAIGEICRAHGMPNLSYLEGKEFSLLRHGRVRVALLSALLRLADYLDLTADRAPLLLAGSRVIPRDSQHHWDLHRCISDVTIMTEPSWDITIYGLPSSVPIEVALRELKNSIQNELNIVSPILRGSGLFFKSIDLVLNTASYERVQRRKNPFLRLAAFGPKDIDLFAGRDDDVNQLIEMILGRQVVVLIGESGVGKTSLVDAGAVPRLKNYDYTIVRFSIQSDPMKNLATALQAHMNGPALASPGKSSTTDLLTLIREFFVAQKKSTRLLIIGDHFEQLFTLGMDHSAQSAFVEQLAIVLGRTDLGRCTFLFCLRQDYLPDLYELSHDIPELYERNSTIRLQKLGRENGRQALERASRFAHLTLPPALIERIVRDLCADDGLIFPPYLQIVGFSLYSAAQRFIKADEAAPSSIPPSLYERLGGAEAIVNRYLDGLLDDFAQEDKPTVGTILRALVTDYYTKRRVSRQSLRSLVPQCDNLDSLLDKLVDNRIVKRSLGEYELIHDFLARRVLKLIEKKLFVSEPVRLALNYMDSHYQNRALRSAHIARAAHVSQMHLSVLFRRQLKTTLNAHLNSVRIAAAKQLLEKSMEPAHQVALRVGFSDLASFSRKFKRYENVSPLHYRRSARELASRDRE